MANPESTFLHLVEACDNFPYDPAFADSYYKLYIPNDDSSHGYLTSETVAAMPWTPQFQLDHATRRIIILPDFKGADPSAAATAALAELVSLAIEQNTFACLGGRHSEPFPFPGAPYAVRLERFACALFGVATRGAHLTAFQRDHATGTLRIWVPRRSARVATWPGMLDSTVAGGVAAGESPWENVVREAGEEASLPAELVRRDARAAGVLSYMGLSGAEHFGHVGLAMPDVVFVYDLEVGEHVVPRPCDEEVECYHLMEVEEVKARMLRGEFKPNCAVVMLDFLVRWGLLTQEDEREYVQIVQRMHRRLPFPVVSGEV